jgi:hypothetical protein
LAIIRKTIPPLPISSQLTTFIDGEGAGSDRLTGTGVAFAVA